MAILGIDLGTTNSLGTVFRNGKVEFIPNSLGELYTPSVVAVTKKGEIVTGAIAREMLITDPKCSVAEFKEFMGLPKSIELGKYNFSPEELSSFIIRSIVRDASVYLNEKIKDVIISVPAYFHDVQRKATRKAGALAGVNVLRIINEPSAAALSSYVDRNKEEVFLVFDFGGGTLDVSIVDCFDTMVEIVGISGDTIGGKDIDKLVAEDFLKEHDMCFERITEEDKKKVIRAAERCKISLSGKEKVEMHVKIHGKDYVSTFDNNRMINICKPIFEKSKAVLERCFRSSGYNVGNISKAILAGGSSNMPVVQLYLKLLLKDIPIVCADSMNLIAKGLGIYAGIIERKKEVSQYIMTDICPFSIGTDVQNINDGRGYMDVIIPRNSVLPISRTKRYFGSSKQQKSILIKVLQGEQVYADRNRVLGNLEIPMPKEGGEKGVDVTYTYDLDGILIVTAKVVSTGKQYQLVLAQEMSDEEIKIRTQKLRAMLEENDNSEVTKYIKNKLESMYQEIDSERQSFIRECIMQYNDILASSNPIEKIKFEKYITGIINSFEDYDPFNV